MDLGISGGSPLILLGTSAAAALFGGWHCAAMCGALAATCSNYKFSFLYQLGRLLVYLGIGVLAGITGSKILGEIPAEVSLIVKVLLLAMTVWILWASGAVQGLQQIVFKKLWQIRSRSRWINEHFLLGILNGFLPCSWLYAFVIVAAGLQSGISGAAVLFGLWLGSLPWLMSATFISVGFRKFPVANSVAAQWALRTAILIGVTWSLFGHSIQQSCH